MYAGARDGCETDKTRAVARVCGAVRSKEHVRQTPRTKLCATDVICMLALCCTVRRMQMHRTRRQTTYKVSKRRRRRGWGEGEKHIHIRGYRGVEISAPKLVQYAAVVVVVDVFAFPECCFVGRLPSRSSSVSISVTILRLCVCVYGGIISTDFIAMQMQCVERVGTTPENVQVIPHTNTRTLKGPGVIEWFL